MDGYPIEARTKSLMLNMLSQKKAKGKTMGEIYYKQGVSAGRKGSEPSPPTRSVSDPVMGVSKEAVEKMAEDYKAGYEAGTQQRLADEIASHDEDDD